MKIKGFAIIVAKVWDASAYVSQIWGSLLSMIWDYIYCWKCCNDGGKELWDMSIRCAFSGKTCGDKDHKLVISCREV